MDKIKIIYIIFCIIAIIIVVCIINILINDGTISLEIVNKADITQDNDLVNSVVIDRGFGSEDAMTSADIAKLRQKYYIVPAKTEMTPDLFNVKEFKNAYLKIDTLGDKPKVLVFHTHSTEKFADSGSDLSEGIVGAGERLCRLLQERYNLKCIHVTKSFDIVDGKPKIMGAYERMEPYIRKVLSDNPSVEMVIDMHRDGVPEGTHLVNNINGKPTAEVMFFNGLCLLKENGKLIQPEGLSNPYIKTNLALSYNLKINADKMYPKLARKIYLNAYRYSLHMRPLSTLIEVGAQTNTKEEIYNAIDLLADVIGKTVTE